MAQTNELVALKDFKFGGVMIRRNTPVDGMGERDVRFYTAVGALGPRDADGSGNVIAGKPFDPRVETVEQFEQRKATKSAPKRAARKTAKRKTAGKK
jgi:hypothetical protein